jgi:endonuclease IV
MTSAQARVHLNDSKQPLGSRRDRHEHIGRGEIGLAGFHALLNDPRFSGVPKVLETPKRDDAHEDRANLRVLRRLIGSEAPPRRRPSWRTPPSVDRLWATRLRKGE